MLHRKGVPRVLGAGIFTLVMCATTSVTACSRFGAGRNQAPAGVPLDTLAGVAMFPDAVDPFLGAQLHVRLVDLQSTDNTRILLASTTQHISSKSSSVSWFVELPDGVPSRVRDDALLILSVEDRTGVRYLGSGRVHDLRAGYLPRRAPGSVEMLGLQLSALPPH